MHLLSCQKWPYSANCDIVTHYLLLVLSFCYILGDYELHSKLLEQERPRQRDNRPQPVLHDGVPVHPLQAHQPSPFAYGDADLFPGHPGQGGMIMDPFRSGGMGLRPPMHPGVPRVSVPPGARFDPFGPLTEFDHSTGSRRPPRSFDPNPDHLQRPGFNDDMYM